MLFVDEVDNNDTYDADEDTLDVAGVTVTLEGPGDESMSTETDDKGMYTFTELRTGTYRVKVSSEKAAEELAAAERTGYGYGGPADFKVTVAAAGTGTQNIPFDITHQTVEFTVTLRRGEAEDDEGDALEGAMVTLYRDHKGEYKIADGETGADGMAEITFARAEVTTANTVYASVMAPDGEDDHYEVLADPEGMQEVVWASKDKTHAVSNTDNILNLMAVVNFSAETVTRDGHDGSGKALAGWAVDVTMGDGEAVEGAPETLGADGMATLKRKVAAADLLESPVIYTFAVDSTQKKMKDGSEKDGGEEYTATSETHKHDGLSADSEETLDPLVVTYTTQSLVVYVHHDRDQVPGYTGSILGEDERKSGMVILNVRHVVNDRHEAFVDWKQSANTVDNGKGMVTFTNLPADKNVVVKARADTFDIIVLGSEAKFGHNDELFAYRDFEENGVEGGAFGANGGYSHTVELCPLKKVDPTNQFHGECGSFAYVMTYGVTGDVTKKVVYREDKGGAAADQDFVGADNFDPTKENPATAFTDTTIVASVEDEPSDVSDAFIRDPFSMTPVMGRHLASGDDPEEVVAKIQGKDVANTKSHNETHEFVNGKMAEGHYALNVPKMWQAAVGAKVIGVSQKAGEEDEYHVEGVARINVTPETGYLYGKVWAGTTEEYFGVADATVTVGDRSATTDAHGRYILEGFYATGLASKDAADGSYKKGDAVATVTITGSEGEKKVTKTVRFAKNDPIRLNAQITQPGITASVSGTVTDTDDEPVAGVKVYVVGVDSTTTNADGKYEIPVPVSELTQYATKMVTVTAKADDPEKAPGKRTMLPRTHSRPVGPEVNATGVNFEAWVDGTISGRVVRPGGTGSGPLQSVRVVATPTDGTYADPYTAVTGTDGRYTLYASPLGGTYTVTATKTGNTFTYPTGTGQNVAYVAEGAAVRFGDIFANTRGILSVTAKWTKTDTVTVEWKVGVSAADADSVRYYVRLFDDRDNPLRTADALTNSTGAGVANDTSKVVIASDDATLAALPDTAMVVAEYPTYTEAGLFDGWVQSDTMMTTVAELVPSAKITTKADSIRGIDTTADPDVDSLSFAWAGTTNGGTEQRVLLEADVIVENDTTAYWFVVTSQDANIATNTIGHDTKAWAAALVPVSGAGNTVNLLLADGSQTLTVTGAALRKELRIAVEVRQTVATGEDANDWVRSKVVTIPEKE